MTKNIICIILSCFFIGILSCNNPQSKQNKTPFTKVDSLTDTYLILQDSLLHAWNVMTWDEKEKIKAMHSLLHLMQNQNNLDDQQLITLEQRLEQLGRIRFTQKTLGNSYVIEEYDFASNSLVSEIISLAETDPSFLKDESTQRLVDKVKMADQRVYDFREAYDRTAIRYNHFLKRNEEYLKEIDQNYTGEKRSLFQMAYE